MEKRTINIGQLRKNPTPALRDVERGLAYLILRRGKPIAKLVPLAEEDRWVNNRAQVDDFLARTAKPDHRAWLSEIEADRAGEGGHDW